MANISVKYNNTEYKDSLSVDCPSNGMELDIIVIVDGNEFLNNFYHYNDSKNVSIIRNRNRLRIQVLKNTSLYERTHRIILTSTIDSSVIFTIIINQDEMVYTISTDTESVTFNNLLDKEDAEYEYKDIIVTTNGDIDDFCYGKAKKYVYVEGDWYESIYDGALNITRFNNILRITNYGKVAMEDIVKYVITLYHKRDSSKTCDITINYNSDLSSGFSF